MEDKSPADATNHHSQSLCKKITETDVRDDETRDGDVNSPEGLTVISADISGQSLTGG